jgi:hypothetical protein
MTKNVLAASKSRYPVVVICAVSLARMWGVPEPGVDSIPVRQTGTNQKERTVNEGKKNMAEEDEK